MRAERDGAALISMEEREYPGGQCDQYEAALMEEEPPLPSVDGARKRNPPERCLRPFYSQDSAQEDPDSDRAGENLNIEIFEVMGGEVFFTKEEEEEIPIATRADESTQKDMQKCLRRRYLKRRCKEEVDYKEEEETEDEHCSLQSVNVVVKPEVDEDWRDVTVKEEEAEGVPPAGRQKKTLPGCRVLHDTKPKDILTIQNADGLGSNLASGQKILTIPHRTMEGDKPFSCAECGGFFKHKSSLVLHRRIHSGEKPFSCSQCGRSFTQKANYIRHQRLHTGEKPYQCGECGKQYAQKQSLVMHQKFHAENEPYSCPECGASFIRLSHLVNHRKTHKGLRRYTCPDCGDFFMLRSSLVIHQRVHSAERPVSS